MLKVREQEHKRTERLRGWVVYLLYKSFKDGQPLELAVLMGTLDSLNFPMTRKRMSAELQYLKSLGVLRVFPLGAEEEVATVKQSKFLQRYADTDSDSEAGFSLCAVLTTTGVDFQEHNAEIASIHRVD